ncbi:MAG: hypothetical protein B6U85_01680 [Desulfurococcales archaeon ex4484_42]|nr:MAG: hypothetical protein B6U85_01680 [Desulfurococcales archaeon ex4484_42]
MVALRDIETYILGNIDELTKECAHMCRANHIHTMLTLDVEEVYEGCEYCLIYTALDHLDLPTLSLSSGIEYVILDDAVIEVLENGVAIYSMNTFKERLRDLLEFGIVTKDEVKNIEEWVKSRTSEH